MRARRATSPAGRPGIVGLPMARVPGVPGKDSSEYRGRAELGLRNGVEKGEVRPTGPLPLLAWVAGWDSDVVVGHDRASRSGHRPGKETAPNPRPRWIPLAIASARLRACSL